MKDFYKRLKHDLVTYFPYSVEEARARLRAEVSSMRLNWGWWILEPMLQMLVYVLIFGYIFRARTEYFPAYVFIGLIIWRLFSSTVTAAAKMIRSNKSVLQHVYLPRFSLLVTLLLVNGFKMIIAFAVVLALMVWYRIRLSLLILYLPLYLILLCLFTFGISAIAAHIGVFVDDIQNLLPILLRLMMYFTGVFYSIEDRIPGKVGSLILHLNPVAYIIDCARKLLLFQTPVSFRWFFLWLAVSLVLCRAGLSLLYRYGSRYLKVV